MCWSLSKQNNAKREGAAHEIIKSAIFLHYVNKKAHFFLVQDALQSKIPFKTSILQVSLYSNYKNITLCRKLTHTKRNVTYYTITLSNPYTYIKQPLTKTIVPEQTAQIYLDNVFPLRLSVWDIRQLVFKNSKRFLESKVHQTIPTNELPHDFTVKQILPRYILGYYYKTS